MIVIPAQSPGHKTDLLLIVLEPPNLERMTKFDPAEINLAEIPIKLVDPTVIVAYEDDRDALQALLDKGDLDGALRRVHRGYQWRPDLGDGEPAVAKRIN